MFFDLGVEGLSVWDKPVGGGYVKTGSLKEKGEEAGPEKNHKTLKDHQNVVKNSKHPNLSKNSFQTGAFDRVTQGRGARGNTRKEQQNTEQENHQKIKKKSQQEVTPSKQAYKGRIKKKGRTGKN